ncbi:MULTISPECIES: HAD family hydrolase [Acetobacter]|jgi:HAD superfamily hydrolase (TIGR01509 family)|uniref:HAD superfamily hydrolase (TIGR01509 family) n=1 Tax=Acetobacter lovaniensis TaxID=104100 RepID=A0A841QGE2_9PROT|nr:HAD family phosphatase [Acetobacter lovaniensis]MBB6457621.1 HAD superfamily hydrolase (TIGR01509 family) [Acetobacter lovaniensis]MCI1698244.1 HAD family phosphatase [Acetobacter lovaniensis]MCP1240019.1 HAD family phosphatase [Acetobacter lovaniensis]NHN81905.1 HAD-IA family hydrolase [Acetobacter lovaniensis]GBQ64669.1 phosphatase [Acetobacter lovaniensis NRIC 0474]
MSLALSQVFRGPLKLVIFDCDGVLVDSEETCCRLCAQAAREAGWDVPDALAVHTFSGMSLATIQPMIERNAGKKLGTEWEPAMQQRFVVAMKEGVEPITGVHAMLDAVQKLGVSVRVASNSSCEEMDVKFEKTSLSTYFDGRIHSARDMGVPKPQPDVYLKAAEAEGVLPCECVVLEDSDPGARAAVDAGMACVMLRAPEKAVPDWKGIERIEKLSDFPHILSKLIKVTP